MSEIEYSKVKCVVLDAFGTIATLTSPQRPYSVLRDMLAVRGATVDDFAIRAMSTPSSMANLAMYHGVDFSMEQMSHLDGVLFKDLSGMELATGIVSTITRLVEGGIRVVIGSNLGLPYGVLLERMLATHGLLLEEMSPTAKLARAFSYEMGHIKPLPSFYEKIEHDMKLPPNAFLMMGDRHEEDRIAPLARGWQAEWAFNRVEASPKIWEELLAHMSPVNPL